MGLSSRDRRTLTIAGGFVTGIVVIAVAIGLLRGDEVARARIVDRAHVPGSSSPPMPARVLSERDPFSPPPALQTPKPTDAPPLDDQTPGATPPEPTGTGSFSTPPTSTTPPTAPPDCEPARPSECRRVGTHVIVLVRVLSRHPRPSADLELDGEPETNIRQGDRFGEAFKLVGFNDALCPRFIFGREGFTLCEHDRRS